MSLSPSETRVTIKVSKTGCSNRVAAEDLHVTEKTIKFHLTNIYKKCGVKNRSELVLGVIERTLPANIMKQIDVFVSAKVAEKLKPVTATKVQSDIVDLPIGQASQG